MLEIRPTCEHCGVALPNAGPDAMICTFECTFCRTCVETVLFNVCPNCGGGFERRPTRPRHWLEKHQPSVLKVLHPVERQEFDKLLKMFKDTRPQDR